LGAALVFLGLLFSPLALSEESAGDVTTTRRETELRKEPSVDAESMGILPAKSLVTLNGEQKGKFIGVDVELEEGTVSGWIDSSVIKKAVVADEEIEQVQPERKVIKVRKSKKGKSKIAIPKDESVLLRRDPTFSYGAVVGGHLESMSVESTGEALSGNGLSAGVSLSFLIDASFRLRTELTYTSHSGMDSNDRLLGVSFMDVSALGELPLSESFFVFGGFQYSFGLGVDNLDLAVPAADLGAASELSGPWAQLGVGYRFSVAEMSYLSLRARYMGAIVTSPLSFHTFGLQAVWEIEG
jgi:hypothetical protein